MKAELTRRITNILGQYRPESESSTPCYVYDMEHLRLSARKAILAARDAFPNNEVELHFALKANNEPEIIGALRDLGFGADTVSIEEVEHAIANGFTPRSVVFAGVGKTTRDIIRADALGVGMINIESIEEIDAVSLAAKANGRKIDVALRINPNIDAHTHAYITTGLDENKFGISAPMIPTALDKIMSDSGISLMGLHFHIGSQILDSRAFASLAKAASEIVSLIENNGHPISHLNLGGGLGVDYRSPDKYPFADFDLWFGTIADNLDIRPGIRLHFEPGRSICAESGTLLCRVARIKHGVAKRFVVLDAGFNALLRPAFYHASHKIENLSAAMRPSGSPSEPDTATRYDVVGPLCESSDVFAGDVPLKDPREGDIIAIRDSGAYGSSMASAYNLRKLKPSIFI